MRQLVRAGSSACTANEACSYGMATKSVVGLISIAVMSTGGALLLLGLASVLMDVKLDLSCSDRH